MLIIGTELNNFSILKIIVHCVSRRKWPITAQVYGGSQYAFAFGSDLAHLDSNCNHTRAIRDLPPLVLTIFFVSHVLIFALFYAGETGLHGAFFRFGELYRIGSYYSKMSHV